LDHNWVIEFLEAEKQRLAGNSKREADSSEVKELRKQNEQYKQLGAELPLKNRVLKNLLRLYCFNSTEYFFSPDLWHIQ